MFSEPLGLDVESREAYDGESANTHHCRMARNYSRPRHCDAWPGWL